jgi:hypothetical protein
MQRYEADDYGKRVVLEDKKTGQWANWNSKHDAARFVAEQMSDFDERLKSLEAYVSEVCSDLKWIKDRLEEITR